MGDATWIGEGRIKTFHREIATKAWRDLTRRGLSLNVPLHTEASDLGLFSPGWCLPRHRGVAQVRGVCNNTSNVACRAWRFGVKSRGVGPGERRGDVVGVRKH